MSLLDEIRIVNCEGFSQAEIDAELDKCCQAQEEGILYVMALCPMRAKITNNGTHVAITLTNPPDGYEDSIRESLKDLSKHIGGLTYEVFVKDDNS